MAGPASHGTFTSWAFPRASLIANLALAAVALYWLNRVNTTVRYPYLDEVFHVRQAQTYCRGDFKHWDPKITTPPGLYLISWLVQKLIGDCCTSKLRIINWFILSYLTYKTALACRIKLQHKGLNPRGIQVSNAKQIQALLRDVHTAINICLFPPLFFVSALYYTDVAATFSVLLSYRMFVHFFDRNPSLLNDFVTTSLGIFALLFRQTNIFWVAIFPAGLLIVDEVKLGTARITDHNTLMTQHYNWKEVIVSAWENTKVYDLIINAAFIDDYFKTAASIVVSSIRLAPGIVTRVRSYLLILLTFGGFVYWNGGVVLGDKSNHVATLHLPQMLYIWPYILFFSYPIAYPFVLAALFPHSIPPSSAINSRSNSKVSRTRTRQNTLPRPSIFIALTLLTLPVIHYNTIIHPFTLADNRHYTFYVFRRLLAHPSLKYLAAPIYLASAWAAIQTLAAPTAHVPSRRPVSPTVSFVLVWLAASALGLVTAPLVEPRYCIVPWIIWRLHVPDVAAADGDEVARKEERDGKGKPGGDEGKGKGKGRVEEQTPSSALSSVAWTLQHGDHRLWLETAWFLLVNAVTGYIFLYRGFAWPQEPGQVQRFMW